MTRSSDIRNFVSFSLYLLSFRQTVFRTRIAQSQCSVDLFHFDRLESSVTLVIILCSSRIYAHHLCISHNPNSHRNALQRDSSFRRADTA